MKQTNNHGGPHRLVNKFSFEKPGLPFLPESQVVDVVFVFIEEKLPDPIEDSLETFLEDDTGVDLLSSLGSLFNRKK